MNMIEMILTDNGWTNPKQSLLSSVYDFFIPDHILNSHKWEADVKKLKQKCIDKQNENNKFVSDNNSDSHLSRNFKENVVKIVDKSYLEKSFVAGEHKVQIYETITKFELNKEQKRAFRIIANHSISPYTDQLKMYLGGMCYNFEQLSDSSLYLCLVLGKLSIVYSHLLGSRFNLSSLRVPLVSGIV